MLSQKKGKIRIIIFQPSDVGSNGFGDGKIRFNTYKNRVRVKPNETSIQNLEPLTSDTD